MTLAQLRARLRAELGDETAGAAVWSDALLDGFLGNAVERLGRDAPAEAEARLLPDADGAYTLPADLLRLHAVYPDADDGARAEPLRVSEYAVWAGRLRAPSAGGSALLVRYAAPRRRPAASGDVDLRGGEEPAAIWLAAAYAMDWLAKQREKAGLQAAGHSTVGAEYARRYADWLAAGGRVLRRRAAG